MDPSIIAGRQRMRLSSSAPITAGLVGHCSETVEPVCTFGSSASQRTSKNLNIGLHNVAMPPPKEKGTCKCEWLERAADDPKTAVEFDAKLNEYHLVRGPKDYLVIYYCPFCGGSPPKSRRDRLFHKLTDAERHRLVTLTKDMRTVEDVTRAFGEPDVRQPAGMVTTNPEREGKPETTQSYPVMIYRKLSDIADVHVIIYPTERVSISFQGKVKKHTD
jgi:hypothetical protein